MFQRVLIANRGEIAVRVIRTCRRLGIHSIAVYSEADAGAMHVREADSAEYIGPPPAAESYLNIEAVLDAARRAGAEAIHPGYGFLSENADFAEACADAGFAFVGPSAEAIRAMGDKVQARRLMAAAGVPVIPGYDGEDGRPAAIAKAVQEIGYPLMVKAAAGGGGRGMRVVRSPDELDEALDSASREAAAAFGDGRIFFERLIEGGRHIEAQIVGDQSGRVVFLGERECSVQRRHQKVIEECPSPAVDDDLRVRIEEAAIKAGETVSYTNAGTVEFLLTPEGTFYFLEMNTRLQVEHPVTEEIYGLDLVEWQLRVAAGQQFPQESVRSGGLHAIEFRLYAEDPYNEFTPSPGTLVEFDASEGWTRVDAGYQSGDEVTPFYDPLLAKLVIVAGSREYAVHAAQMALRRVVVRGPVTNRNLLFDITTRRAFKEGWVGIQWLETELERHSFARIQPWEGLIAAGVGMVWPATADPWRALHHLPSRTPRPVSLWHEGYVWRVIVLKLDDAHLQVEIGDESHNLRSRSYHVTLETRAGNTYRYSVDGWRPREWEVYLAADHVRVESAETTIFEFPRLRRGSSVARSAAGSNRVIAPMTGLIVRILAEPGEEIAAGQPVAILEAMKMEHQLNAPADGVIDEIFVEEGQRVEEGTTILSLSAQRDRHNAVRAD